MGWAELSFLVQVMLKLGQLFSEMIFQQGFVHCDPHPGNILVRRDSNTGKLEIVMLDHGLYSVSDPLLEWTVAPTSVPH